MINSLFNFSVPLFLCLWNGGSKTWAIVQLPSTWICLHLKELPIPRDKSAVALDIANIIYSLFYAEPEGRITMKSKQRLFVKIDWFSWSLDLRTQGPLVPTGSSGGHFKAWSWVKPSPLTNLYSCWNCLRNTHANVRLSLFWTWCLWAENKSMRPSRWVIFRAIRRVISLERYRRTGMQFSS